MLPIVYSSKYNITAFGLERLHPFDSCKYQRIVDWLITQGRRKWKDFHTPVPCTRTDLLRIHTPDYLNSLRQPRVLASILELPLLRYLPGWLTDWRVLTPMRYATGGTVLACHLALERGLAINLGGGYHHASSEQGWGFCVYADIPLALSILRREGKIRSALVVDTDAHQGDGTANVIRPWVWAHQLDFFQENIFPWPKVQEDISVPLPSDLPGPEYLDLIREHLPAALDLFCPDLVIYNAGSDVLRTDPLTQLALTPADLAERDLLVVSTVRARQLPLALLLSGGYGPLSWEAQARSIAGLLARFDHCTA